MSTESPAGALQAAAARNQINITSRSLRLMTAERTQAIVDTLTSARRSYVTATRSSYALAYYFHYVGRMISRPAGGDGRYPSSLTAGLLPGARDAIVW